MRPSTITIPTVRSECLDWLLILNDQRLEQVLDVFVEHYNGHRLIERWSSIHPPTRHADRCRRRLSGARLVSGVATVSVVWFTSTSWRRDHVSAPYTDRLAKGGSNPALVKVTVSADDMTAFKKGIS
jgi:hypothetical protein